MTEDQSSTHSLASIKSQMSETLRLAAPIMAARAGILAMVLIDSAMTGRVSARELAYFGLGIAPQLVLTLVGVGLLQGGIVLIAQAYGAGETQKCGAIWLGNLSHGVVFGLAFAGLALLGGPLAALVGIDPDLAAGAGRVAVQFAWGIPGMLCFIACQYFFEGIKKPKVGMIALAIAVAANIPLNLIFVMGWGGWVSPMGAAGAVATTSFLRWALFIGIAFYMAIAIDRRVYGLILSKASLLGPTAQLIRQRIRRLGAPIALAQGMQSAAFAALTLMAGRLGQDSVAAHQATMMLNQFLFMVTVGLGAATSVRVGHAVGDGDQTGVRAAGWSGVSLIVLVMIVPSLMMTFYPFPLIRIFVTEPSVIAIARWTVLVAGISIFFDGAMGVMLGALRGAGDVWLPLGIQITAFWGFAIPIAFVLAFSAQLGAPGLIMGILGGTITASSLLILRFRSITTRSILRVPVGAD